MCTYAFKHVCTSHPIVHIRNYVHDSDGARAHNVYPVHTEDAHSYINESMYNKDLEQCLAAIYSP